MEASEVVSPTPEQTPAAPEPAPEPASPEAPTQAAPDTSDAQAQMLERLERMEGLLSAREEPAETDPWAVLSGQADEDLYDDPETQPGQGQPEQLTEEQMAIEELNRMVDQRVQQVVTPFFEQQETARRAEAIRGLAEKYPDFKSPEVLGPIDQEMAELANRYGNPALRTDPVLAERIYQAHKAAAVAAAETPAEAGREGASLETGAGPGQPEPTTTPEQEYLAPIMALAPQGRDAIT